MSKKKIVFVIIIFICIILGIYLVPKAVNLRRNWETPLGPVLGLPSQTPTVTQVPTTQEPSLTISAISPTPLPTLTPTQAPLCGGPSTMIVLGIGSDAENYLYGLADVIRIVRADFVTPKVTVLSMPRDMWVKIPEISDHYGIDAGKLNQSYFYGGAGNGYYDGPGEGPGLLARTLDLNFGLRVDHYGAVNMVTFVKIIDALGGIDVYLPEAVDGRTEDVRSNMGYFEAGFHHFSGLAALKFSRIRHGIGVFQRNDNQTLVLCAVRDKILTPSVLPALPGIISSFRNSVQTDLSPAQISQLLCLLPKISIENLIFASLPEEYLTGASIYDPQLHNYTFVWQWDQEKVLATVNQFLNGDWPIHTDNTPSCPKVVVP